MIRIIRPTNTRDQFGDGDDYKGTRTEVFKCNSNVGPVQLKEGKEGAEQMFHIFNAPGEILSNWEQALAKDFREPGNYSLSVGDVVEVKGKQFLCESYAWRELDQPCNEVEVELVYGLS